MHSSQNRWPQVVDAGLTISSKQIEHFHMSSSPRFPLCCAFDVPPLREAVARGGAATAPVPSSTVTFMLSPLRSMTPRVLLGASCGRRPGSAPPPAGAGRFLARRSSTGGLGSESESESSKSITSFPRAALGPDLEAAIAAWGTSSSARRSVRSTAADGMMLPAAMRSVRPTHHDHAGGRVCGVGGGGARPAHTS